MLGVLFIAPPHFISSLSCDVLAWHAVTTHSFTDVSLWLTDVGVCSWDQVGCCNRKQHTTQEYYMSNKYWVPFQAAIPPIHVAYTAYVFNLLFIIHEWMSLQATEATYPSLPLLCLSFRDNHLVVKLNHKIWVTSSPFSFSSKQFVENLYTRLSYCYLYCLISSPKQSRQYHKFQLKSSSNSISFVSTYEKGWKYVLLFYRK